MAKVTKLSTVSAADRLGLPVKNFTLLAKEKKIQPAGGMYSLDDVKKLNTIAAKMRLKHIRSVVQKCVRMRSDKLPQDICHELDALFTAYGECRNLFYARFSSPAYMDMLGSKNSIRDLCRDEQNRRTGPRYQAIFGLSSHAWTEALFSALQNINTQWSNLANRIRSAMRDNKNLTTDERKYCSYVLAARHMWKAVVFGMEPSQTEKSMELIQGIAPERLTKLHHMLHRYTRKYAQAVPRSRRFRTITLDETLYSIEDTGHGESVLYLSSLEKGRRIAIPLKGRWRYRKNGNIQLVRTRHGRCVEIHKCIEAKGANVTPKGELGVDKGLATLLSCSDGNEYGAGFSRLCKDEAERVNARNSNRNHMIQQRKSLLREAAELEAGDMDYMDIQKAEALHRKADIILRHNLGRSVYDRQHNAAVDPMKQMVNTSVNTMLGNSTPETIAEEDLTFTKDKTKDYSSRAHRLLSSWAKGYLSERLGYKASIYKAKIVKVNPAYTSQFCAECGAVLGRRSGTHNEICHCPNCGDGNANINAAKNIKARLHDKEISLYTPYMTVKTILTNRYNGNPAVANATA